MAFDSVSQFLAMGGYGFYVWLAYGAVFFLMTFFSVKTYRQSQSVRRLLQEKYLRQQQLQNRNKAFDESET